MSLNGIAHLSTKRERQNAKLALAAQDRATDGNPRATYDESQLPTLYKEGDNDTNAVVDNPNPGGLVYGRPWINTLPAFTFYEAINTTVALQTTQYVNGVKIYAYSSSYDVPGYQPARVFVDDVQVISSTYRGHNMVVIDPDGVTVSTAHYDTYGSAGDVTALASALNSVTNGNIVILVVNDASSLNASVRSALTTHYASTNANTWSSGRVDHIFIGIKS